LLDTDIVNVHYYAADIVCWKALINADDFFSFFSFAERAVPARQMYTTGSAIVSTRSPC